MAQGAASTEIFLGESLTLWLSEKQEYSDKEMATFHCESLHKFMAGFKQEDLEGNADARCEDRLIDQAV